MKTLLLIFALFIVTGYNSLNTQEEKNVLICIMSVDDILRDNQPFNMDDVVGEKAMILAGNLISELKTAYQLKTEGDKKGLKVSKEKIRFLVKEGEGIDMNLSMFDEDFKNIKL